MKIQLIYLLFVFVFANNTCAEVIDQRDKEYQKAISHLANAKHALEIFQKEIKAAEAAHPMPGLNINAYLAQMEPIKVDLQHLLSPEEIRFETQQLYPESQFFKPFKLKDVNQ